MSPVDTRKRAAGGTRPRYRGADSGLVPRSLFDPTEDRRPRGGAAPAPETLEAVVLAAIAAIEGTDPAPAGCLVCGAELASGSGACSSCGSVLS